MTNCGPLSTPYAAPDDCYQPTFTVSDGQTFSAVLATDNGCFPSACFGGYYSPAVCPQGWNTYTTWLSNWPSPRPSPSETAYGCCYGDLTAQTASDFRNCAGYVTTTAGVAIVGSNTISTTFPLTSIHVSQFDLKIRDKDSDSAPLAAATASSTSSSTGSTSKSSKSSIASSTSSTTPTSSASPSPSASSGLSTGAKAAIGVVIPVVVICALLGLFFFLRRRKQRTGPAPEETPPAHRQSELPDGEYRRHEMESTPPIFEADAGADGQRWKHPSIAPKKDVVDPVTGDLPPKVDPVGHQEP